MNTLGKTIHFLRKSKGVTQEKMAEQIGVSFQTISKWENESTLPDIMMLPLLADYFGVSIDDLFQYKWNVMTSKERMIYFMMQNQILRLENLQRFPGASCGKAFVCQANAFANGCPEEELLWCGGTGAAEAPASSVPSLHLIFLRIMV